MILDRDRLRLLFELSSRVEEVTGEATQVKDSLLSKPGEGRTPEDGYLEEIVSGLEGVERSISSLISQYPEEAVLQMKQERDWRQTHLRTPGGKL